MNGLFLVTAGVPATIISPFGAGAGRGKRGFFGLVAGAAALAGCGGGGGGGGGDGGGDGDGTMSDMLPDVSDNPLADLAVDAGADIVPINLGAAYFMDADGDDSALTFTADGELPTGLMLSDDGVITGRLADPGEHEITIIVTDADGNPFRHTFTITSETPVTGMRRPTVMVEDLAGDRVETVGEAIGGIDVTGGFGDPEDDDDLTFQVDFSRADHGLTFNSDDNTITGTLTGSEDVTAIITVRNGADEDDPSVEHRIVIEANERPTASDDPLPGVINVTGGQAIDPIDLSDHFTDPDGDDADLVFEVSFSTTDGHNLMFDSDTNRISGQLDAGEIVTITITVTVTDGQGAELEGGEISFTVTTAAEGENLPPTSTSEPLLDVVLRTGGDVSLDASGAFRDPDGEDDDLTFGATGLDGTGLSIDTSSGVISGTFSGTGNVDTVTVTATDARGGTFSRDFGITVAASGEPLRGSDDRELFIGGPGDDTIIGGAGDDVASYLGAMADYSLVTGLSTDGGVRVTVDDTDAAAGGGDGTDTLTEIEEIRFSDETVQVSELVQVDGMEAETEILVVGRGTLEPIDLNTWFTAGRGGDLSFAVVFDPSGGRGLTFEDGDMISGAPTGAVTVTVTATETGVSGVMARHTFVVAATLAPSGNPLGDLTVDTGSDIVPIDLGAGFFLPPTDSALTYGAVGLPAGLMIGADGVITGRIADAGTSTVRITATDSNNYEYSLTFMITAEAPMEGQRRPTFVVEDLAGGQIVTVGDEIRGIDVTGGFEDPDGDDNLTYAVAFSRSDSGLTFNSTDNTISGTLAGAGDVVAIVTVTNGSGGRSVEHRILIEANNPPEDSAGGHPNIFNVTGGGTIAPIDVAGRFTDPDGDDLSYAVSFSTADGHSLTFDSDTNQITGQLDAGADVVSVTVTVTVTDGRGGEYEGRFTVTTAAAGVNLPPTMSGEPLRDIVLNTGVDVSVDVSGAFTDPEGGDLTYSAEVDGTALADAGIGLSIDADSGVISGAFTGSANVDDVTVTATDGDGGTASRTFDIMVAATGGPLMGSDDPELFVGGSDDDEIIGGAGDDAAQYGGASAGYTLVTELADDGGVRVTVDDTAAADGDDGTDTLTGIEEIRFSDRMFRVSDLVRVNGTEAETSIRVRTGEPLDPIDFSAWFNAGRGGDLTFGAMFDPTGGQGLSFDGDNSISGSPTGSVTVTVTAMESGVSGVSARHAFTVEINANLAPVVSSLHNVVAMTGATNVSFDVSGAFDDPEGDDLTFDVSGLTGTGLTIDALTGVISGAAFTGEGETRVTVGANDGNGRPVEATFTLKAIAAGADMVGTDGNDLVFANPTADMIDGGGGDNDIVVFDGSRSEYDILGRLLGGGGIRVLDVEETNTPANRDEVRNVEVLRFDGGDVPFDLEFVTGRSEGDPVENILRGGPEGDLIQGLAGNDALYGEGGPDRLVGGRGNDTLRGGAGMDTAVYAKGRSEYVIDTEPGSEGGAAVTWHVVTDKDRDSAGEGSDRLLGVEFLEFDGTRVALGDLTLDRVLGSEGADAALSGGDGSQEIFGFDGNDTLHGGGGGDFLEGGEGNDMLRGDGGDDMIYGDAGMDTAVYAGARAEFEVSFHSASRGASSFSATVRDMVTDTGADEGTDTLTGISAIAFSDQTLTLVETATSGADVLFGNGIQFENGTGEVAEIPEVIDGMGGGDLIFAFEGSDVITGGAGDDTIHGGDGRDIAVFTGARADYTVSREHRLENGNVVVWHVVEHDNSGSDGRDELTGVETLRFSDGDVAVSGLEIGVIEGSGLGDELGRPGGPTDGHDVLYGSDPIPAGTDRSAGFSGFDGSDTLRGLGGDDRIHGFGGDDTIDGGEGDDWIFAGDGDDSIIGGKGNDTIRGGAGSDTLHFNTARSNFTIRKDFRMDADGTRAEWFTLEAMRGAEGVNEVTGVEFVTFRGGQAMRLSSVTTEPDATTALTGPEGAGHDPSTGSIQTILGGEGDDTLWGVAGNDSLEGGGGDDTLLGGAGDDTLTGGAGNDTLVGDVGHDPLPGTDTAVFRGDRSDYEIVLGEGGVTFVRDMDPDDAGDDGRDVLRGIEALRFGDETLTLISSTTGASGGDVMVGGGGMDTLDGGGGGDVMFGGDGDDTLTGGAGGDLIDGGSGSDTAVFTGTRDDHEITERRGVEYGLNENGERVFVTRFEVRNTSSGETDYLVNVEMFQFGGGASLSTSALDPDTVIGSTGDDTLGGGDRANTLSGGSGGDTISGGGGDDTLMGGSGDDTLDGGSGDMDKAQFVGRWVDPDTSGHRFEISHDGTDFIVRDIAGDLGIGAPAVARAGNTRDGIDVPVDAGGQGQDILTGIEVIEFLDPATWAVDREFRLATGDTGTAGHDLILGPATGGGMITGGGGDDVIVGRSPTGDIAVFGGSRGDYTITLEHRPLPGAGSVQVHVVEHMNGGSDGRDELIGIESLMFGSSAATAVGDLELDGIEGWGTLTGGNGDQVIKGLSAARVLPGGGFAGGATLNGGAGDDTLEGGRGNDTLDGGMDRDTAVFSGSFAGYSISSASPTGNLTVSDTDNSSAGNEVDDGTDTLTNVEVLRFADREIAVAAAATAEGEILRGTATADSIDGLAGGDLLLGFGSNDTLTGGAGNDVIDGGAGNVDRAVFSGDRDGYLISEERRVEGTTTLGRIIRVEDIDTADGDDGVDTLRNVEILEFNGVDAAPSDLTPEITITGSSKDDELTGGVGGVLDGGGGVDTAVYTGSRDDFTVTREWLFAGDSDVPTLTFTVEDGAGVVDRLVDIERLRFVGDPSDPENVPVQRLDVVISGDDGDNVLGEVVLVADETVAGLGEEVRLVGSIPVALENIQFELELGTDDTIHGHGGNDIIRGGAGDDALSGGEGRDRLFGGPGDDTLDGGVGRDRIDGGAGVDTVVYAGTIHDYRFTLNPDDLGSIVVIDSRVGGHFDEAGALHGARADMEAELEKARALEEGRALDEGRDELVDVEIIRFGDGREIRTTDIEFGSVPLQRGTTFEYLSHEMDGISYTYSLTYDAATRTHQRMVEPETARVVNDAGMPVLDGDGMQLTTLLRAENKVVLTAFDPRQGDRIAIGDIPELKNLTAELVLENNVPVTRLTTPNSDFVLDIVGDFVADEFVKQVGRGQAATFNIEDTGTYPFPSGEGPFAFDIQDYIDYVDPKAESSRIHVRPGGESTMTGHDGLDVFQFLAAEDSAGSGRTTIGNFDPLGGDIISLADNGDLRGLSATLHLVTGVGPVTRLTSANSTFELDIAGDFVIGSSVAIVAGTSPGTTVNSIIMDGDITPSTILSPASHDPARGIDPGIDIFDHINYIGGARFPVGGVENDEIEGGVGNDTLTGGPGNDSLDGGGGVDTAFYFGGVRNFQFAPDAQNPDHLAVTDANARNNPGEGVDTLMNIEKLQFGGSGGEVRTVVVKFGSMPIVDLVADASTGSVLYGSGGGYTLRGGRGADIFQFLSAEDSPESGRTTIIEFDPGRGDLIALANIPAFENLGAEEMIDGDGLTFTRLSAGSDFELDVYLVGAGSPISRAGGILDHVYIIGRDDHLIGGEGDDEVAGRDGDDRIEGGGGSDRLEGGAGDDTLFGEGPVNGDDGVTDNDVDTAVFSQKRENYLIDIEGSGDSRVVYVTGIGSAASDGVDTLRGIEQLEFAGVGEGQRIVYKLANLGTSGAEALTGSGDGEGIDGGAGDDILFGGAGDDALNGGAGSDIAAYAGVRGEYEVTVEVVWINLGLGSSARVTLVRVEDIADDGMADGSDEGRDTLSGVEFLRFADTGVGREVDVSRLTPDTLTGTEADDTMIGGGGGQTVMAGGGDDVIFGGTDDDIVDGGDDEDTAVHGGAVVDYLFTRDSSGDLVVTDGSAGGGDGTDEGRDTLRNIEHIRFGGLEGDVTVSVANIHIVTDNSAAVTGHATENNIFHGAGGGFSFTGGSGADVFQFLAAGDSPTAGMTTITGFDPTQGDRVTLADITALDNLTTRIDGMDTILENTTSNFGVRLVGYTEGLTEGVEYAYVDVGDQPAPTTGGSAGNDTLSGTGSADVIDGGAGMDTISGGGGTDTLRGGAGDDVLVGGAGVDTLTGGAGDDFLYGREVDGAGPANEADVAVFAGFRSDYDISVGGFADGGSDRVWVSVRDVADAGDPNGRDEGRDILVDIDVLRFQEGNDDAGDDVDVMVSSLLTPTAASLPLSALNRTVATGTISPIDVADFFTDPTGRGLTFGISAGDIAEGWSISPEGVLGGTIGTAQQWTIPITATNGDGQSFEQNIEITVRDPGAGERARQVIDTAVVASGKPVEIDIRNAFYDPDNDLLTYDLGVGRTFVDEGPDHDTSPLSDYGLEFDPATGLITGTPSEGVVEIVVRANDGAGDAIARHVPGFSGQRPVLPTFTIHIDPIEVTSSAPGDMTVATGSALAGGIDVSAAFDVPSEILDGRSPTHTVHGLAGTGLTFNSSTNMISGTFTSTEREKITLVAEARGDVEEHSFFIEPNVAPRLSGNAPVLLNTDTPAEMVPRKVLSSIRVDLAFIDDNSDSGDVLTYSLRGNPTGVTVQPSGGLVHVSASAVDGISELDFVIIATDEAGETAEYALTLEVAGAEGDSSGNTLTGGDGNDAIRGKGGDDTITGGAGDDFIYGGTGHDTAVYRGNQADYKFATQLIYVSGGANTWLVVEDMRVNPANPDGRDLIRNIEELDFGDNMDVAVSGIDFSSLARITGDGENNEIFGGPGNQEIRGGGGSDRIHGGGGEDTVVFDGNRGDYEIVRQLNVTHDSHSYEVWVVTNKDPSTGEGAILSGVEKLRFRDTRDGEEIRKSDIEAMFQISVIVGDSAGQTIQGGNTHETFWGRGAQSISAGGGDDWLRGWDGDDILDGGDDLLQGRTAAYEATWNVYGEDGTLKRDADGNPVEEKVYLTGDTAVYNGARDDFLIIKNLIWGVDRAGTPERPSPLPGILPAVPGVPAVTTPRSEAISIEDIESDFARTDEGRDILRNIEYLHFSDYLYLFRDDPRPANDNRFNLVEMHFTHLTGTEEGDTIDTIGKDGDEWKGVGVGDQVIDGGDGTDTVVYAGEIDDFMFALGTDMRLTLTDADTGDGTDEGTDTLVNVETIRFGGVEGTVEVETASIHIVTDNAAPVTARGSARNIFYGEGGGFTFTGGPGADTFQFLTAADSTASSTTTIRDFDQAEGDRVLLAGIGNLRGLSVAKPTVGGETVTQLSHATSGFVLNIAGDHDITALNMGDYVRFIGGPGDGDDVVRGLDSVDDVIEGLGGNDMIDGRGGRDTSVYVGPRTDYTVTSELVVTGSGNTATTETVYIVEDDNEANGDEGRDELRNIETLRFAGVDVQVDSLSPAPMVVKITGDDEKNTLTGGAGDQVIEGGPGDDTIDGGAGTGDVAVYAGDLDEYEIKEELVFVVENGVGVFVTRLTVKDNLRRDLVENGAVVSVGNEGVDTLSGIELLRFRDGEWDPADLGKTVIGSDANDATLMGGPGNDIIDGDNGTDTINGGAGNDIIGGGRHQDTIDGGEGYDTAAFRGALSGYSISASLANGVVTLTVDDTDGTPLHEFTDNLVNVEQLSFFGWKGPSHLDASATDPLTRIIAGSLYEETALVVVADHTVRNNNGAGAEIIVGDDEANGTPNRKVDGGAGDDWIFGFAGDDHIQGGLGDDKIFGGVGSGDTAYFLGAREDYIIWRSAPGTTQATFVQDRDRTADGGYEGRDRLIGVENIRFGDADAVAISSITTDTAPPASASVIDGFVNNPPDSVQYVAGRTVNASAWFDVPPASTAEYGISSPASFTINSSTGEITAPGALTRSTPVTVTVSTVPGAANTFDDVSHTVLFVSPPEFLEYAALGTVDASTWFGVVPVPGQNPVYTISSRAPFTIDAATGVITAPATLDRSTQVTVTASRDSGATDDDVSHTVFFTTATRPVSLEFVAGKTLDASIWFGGARMNTQFPEAEYSISTPDILSDAFTINPATGVFTSPDSLADDIEVTVTLSIEAGETDDNISHTVLFNTGPRPSSLEFVAGKTLDASTWFGGARMNTQFPEAEFSISTSETLSDDFTINPATGVITSPNSLASDVQVTVTLSIEAGETDDNVSHTVMFTVPQTSQSIAEFPNGEDGTSTSGDRAVAPAEGGDDPFLHDPDEFEAVTPTTGDGDYFGL